MTPKASTSLTKTPTPGHQHQDTNTKTTTPTSKVNIRSQHQKPIESQHQKPTPTPKYHNQGTNTDTDTDTDTDTKHQTPNTRHQTPNTEHQTPNTTPNTDLPVVATLRAFGVSFKQFQQFRTVCLWLHKHRSADKRSTTMHRLCLRSQLSDDATSSSSSSLRCCCSAYGNVACDVASCDVGPIESGSSIETVQASKRSHADTGEERDNTGAPIIVGGWRENESRDGCFGRCAHA